MKNRHILHSFCKFISPQTNANNGYEKQNKQSTNEQNRRIKTSTNKNPNIVINEVGTCYYSQISKLLLKLGSYMLI